MLEKLIGSQILKIEDSFITLKKEDKVFTLEFKSDDGGCCGYADFELNVFYDENSERNPIITNVDIINTDGYDSETTTLTFYGENKELCNIESNAGSGSGWSYGACVSITCKELGIDEDIASW